MKHSPVIHPFLFAIYPVISLLATSLGILNPSQAIRPAIIAILVSTAIFLIFYGLYHDWYRAGFMASMVIFMLFYYGYSYRLPPEMRIFGVSISRHLVILFFWIVLLSVMASSWLWHRVRARVINNFLNITAGLAFLYAIFMLVNAWIPMSKDPLAHWSRPANLSEDNQHLSGAYRPDIYYLILDGYARSDTLQQIYHFDNSNFYTALEQRGFYIAEASHSNYAGTPTSLASSMNFEYLDNLAAVAGSSTNSEPLGDLMVHSRLRAFLEQAGYDIYLSGEYLFAETHDPAIVFYSPQAGKVTTFESLVLGSTMFQILADLGKINFSTYSYETQRQKILHGFAEVERLVEHPSPKFVFLHVIAPHPPFVFDAQGNPIQPRWAYNILDGDRFLGDFDEYITGYVAQMQYINRRTLETIDQILQNSPTPPIIILQGDHGPAALMGSTLQTSCLSERLSILNAYYLPDGKTDILYPSITPVNTFRVIFDAYYGTSLARLPDRNYFSREDYQFVDVTGQVDTPCQLPPPSN